MAVGLEQFVKSLEDSGIITPSKLRAVREKLPSEKQHDAQELARELVRLQKLTKFQAQEAYQGKAKNLVLGNYVILDKIGAGGMGQVYKAEHRRMHRTVAIKMLPSSMTKDAAAIARFEREVTAAAKLRHTNIVAADDADQARGIHFLVMEYVEGSDFSALVKKNGPFPLDKAVNYILQAARGLEYAHSEGVVHRDIKPANLLLDKKGTVKILDMGLARLESGIGGDAGAAAELTTSGQIMGTVDYMSPEQAFNTKQADARADIYSLGCTLFYLLTGKPLYSGETIMEKLLAHRERPIPVPSELGIAVPQELEAVLQKMLAKTPADRYQSMTDVIADLQACGVGGGSTIGGKSPSSTDAAGSNSNLTFLKDAGAGRTIQRTATKPVKQSTAIGGRGSSTKKFALIGAALLAVLVVAGIVVSLRTKDGTLVVEIDQPGAIVQVLDAEGKVEVNQSGGAGKVTISVDPGQHRLKVEKDGFAVFGQEFEIESGGQKVITAKLMAGTPAALAGNYALDFQSGRMSRVVTPIHYDGSHPLTIEALVTPRNVSAPFSCVIGDSDSQSGVALALSDGKWKVEMRQLNSAANAAVSRGAANSDVQVHVAGVFKGNEVHLFVDGVFQTMAAREIVRPSKCPILIGASPLKSLDSAPFFAGLDSVFDGTIDEVRISKVARYPGKSKPEPRFTADADTIALYHFDEGSGETAIDASENKHDARVFGAKWVKVVDSGAIANSSSQLFMHDPTFPQWVKRVQAMPAAEQIGAVSKKLIELNPGFDGTLTDLSRQRAPLIEDGVVTEVRFICDYVEDISPIRGFAGLKRLTCVVSDLNHTSPLADLSPLKGMALETIATQKSKITDLSALNGMPLQNFDFNWSRITDLSPLQDCPLKTVSLRGSWVSDLRPLQSCQGLTYVHVGNTKVTAESVAALQRAVPNCNIIWDDPTKAGSSPTPTGSPATASQLFMHHPAFPLWVARVQAMPAADQIKAVSAKLVELNPGFDGKVTGVGTAIEPKIANNVVTEFGFLTDDIADISPVRALAGLKSLSCNGRGTGKLTDLSPLKGLPITNLYMPFNRQFADLSPLRSLDLVTLNCSHSEVTDLGPLEECKNLKTLHISQTKVTSTSIAALRKAIPNCNIIWSQPAAPSVPVGPSPPLAKAPFNATEAKRHQRAWADHLGTEIETPNSVGMKMVLIPPGEFLMGSNDAQIAEALKAADEIGAAEATQGLIGNAERPQHRAVITKPLLLGATEVTVGQFKKFGATGYQTDAEKSKVPTYLNPGYAVTDDSPVAAITWNDAVTYCNWLSAQENLEPCYQSNADQWRRLPGKNGYRLPSEAEWEYACRAGTTTQYSFGDDHQQLEQFAWYQKNGSGRAHAVGTKQPNGFGLHDMHGNLWEWCHDFYDEKAYDKASLEDPSGPVAGSAHVIRGGVWQFNAANCRSAFRPPARPAVAPHPHHGFRVVRTIDLTTPAGIAPRSAAPRKPITDFNSPEFLAWVKEVQAMPVQEQVEAIRQKLMELNPGFDGKLTAADGSNAPRIENNQLVTLFFSSDHVVDLSPVRAAAHLTVLHCNGSAPGSSRLADLSPLAGTKLTLIDCSNTEVTDLSPLGQLNLLRFICVGTPVSDLSRLNSKTLAHLWCSSTLVSDLSPLVKFERLASIDVRSTRVTATSVAVLQKAFPNCKIEWDDPSKAKSSPIPSGAAPPPAKAPFNTDDAKKHQAAWAAHLGMEVETPNSVGMTMVLIPPGEFTMGSTDEQVAAALKVAEEIKADQSTKDRIQKAERPPHKVLISQPYLLSATEVTVGQFRKFSNSGYETEAEKAGKPQTFLNPGHNITDDSPAAVITWNDAVAYCQWLSSQEKRTYRLPTEAEWEYACRAGTETQYSFGDDHNELPKYGWHIKNAGNRAHAVGTLFPNNFGLLDMHGNVYEWCDDWYDETWYEKSAPIDPSGPSASYSHVLRGGLWGSSASSCRSAYRHPYASTNRNANSNGFRCLAELNVGPVKPASTQSSTLFMHDPGFPQWVKNVQAMPVAEQIKAVSAKLVELNPGFDGKVTGVDGRGTPTITNGVVTEINVVTSSVTDLSPLRAWMGLKALDCTSRGADGKLADLSPLRGMQLTRLHFHNTKVTDLTPLAGMPLAGLSFSSTKVSSLTPLRGMPLTSLNFNGTQVIDLSPLEGMKLTKLVCSHTKVANLSPLEGMPLSELDCLNTGVTDLAPLHKCATLKSLDLSRTKVSAVSVDALKKALPNCVIEWDGPAKAIVPQPENPLGPAPPPAKAPFNADDAKKHQADWAGHLGMEIETPNSIGMKMVLIPPGEFLMGSTPDEMDRAMQYPGAVKVHVEGEGPQHRVMLTRPYLVGATEVTVGQFQKFLEESDYVSAKEKAERADTAARAVQYKISADLPVFYVPWDQAAAFCVWLSARENLDKPYEGSGQKWTVLPGTGYRLPTEAQWEFACRAGTSSMFICGDSDADLKNHAWLNFALGSGARPREVATREANAFGLFDMVGNAFEWCQDFYDAAYYQKSPLENPTGGTAGSPVLRGSAWSSGPYHARSAYRYNYAPTVRSAHFGFRVVREIATRPKLAN